MRLGVELLSNSIFELFPGSFFDSGVEVNGGVLETSVGRDSYSETGVILAGKRVTATGRVNTYSNEHYSAGLGLGSMEATPAVLFELTDIDDTLLFYLKSNTLLDMGVLIQDFSVQILLDNGERLTHKVPLNSLDVKVKWLSRGEFLISLNTKQLKNRLAAA